MKLLLIEDDEIDADLIKIYLKSVKEPNNNLIELTWVNNLEEALSKIKSSNFDLILLDLNLNSSNCEGLETLDKVLSYEIQAPIVVMTADINEELWSQAINKGAQDYLVKHDVNAKSLLKTITYSLERYKLIKKLENKSEKLLESNKELENFAYVASHDLREPLRKVINFSYLLKEEYGNSLDDQAKQYMNIMQDASIRMGGLLDALLNYSRVGTQNYNFKKVALDKVFKTILDDIQVKIKDTDAQVLIDPNLPELEIEETLIRNLFQNLITNSLKFKKEDEKPVIKVKASKSDINSKIWNITVEDNGIGFGSNLTKKVFEQFLKIHGHDKYDGIGMGLAICKKIAEKHNGQVDAESSPGKGSRFTVSLPELQTL